MNYEQGLLHVQHLAFRHNLPPKEEGKTPTIWHIPTLLKMLCPDAYALRQTIKRRGKQTECAKRILAKAGF